MFTQKWRDHWGLKEDPFNCEDADKDVILSELDSSIVHWSCDRMYGNPEMAAPAIVFGEKGSGKSALRLMIKKRLEEYNRQNPDAKVALIEYIDFNPYLSQYRRSIVARADDKQAAQEVIKRWKVADHLDSILSIGITQFVNEIISTKNSLKDLSRKQKSYLLMLTCLYYNSDKTTTTEALNELKKQVRYFTFRPGMKWMLVSVLSLLGIGLILLPWLLPSPVGPNSLWFTLGVICLLGTWGWFFYDLISYRSLASWASRSIKVLPRNPSHLSNLLSQLSNKERKEYILPRGSDDSSRYQILDCYMDLLENFNYKGLYVLLDRVDEPLLLSVNEELMRQFVERMLDIKLLQYPRLGLKLFLPLEMDAIHRNATPEQLKHMRLDKSNLIPELKWSGQELYEIASKRLQISQNDNAKPIQLSDMIEEGFDYSYLRETLSTLGTPRYAFGFLSTLITEHVKDLPNDLPDDDPRWKITRSRFDVVRAMWIDRSGVLRRILN